MHARPDDALRRAAAAACLPVGFATAVISGVRPLGGVVLVILAALAGRWSGAPIRRQGAWYFVVAVCFAGAHVLAGATGAWGAVAIAAAVATAAYVVILERCNRQYAHV